MPIALTKIECLFPEFETVVENDYEAKAIAIFTTNSLFPQQTTKRTENSKSQVLDKTSCLFPCDKAFVSFETSEKEWRFFLDRWKLLNNRSFVPCGYQCSDFKKE
uniref:Uncharacterized protein n=1 Tax=Lepeophtheirus salmonis TaxID=72036 RepID=A0A0K2TMM9_LEPSM